MDTISEKKYITEKKIFTDMLMSARMHEISYSETFGLAFYKYINTGDRDNYQWAIRKMNLIIDAPFWVFEKTKWEEMCRNNCDMIGMDDRELAGELVNFRYNNLIQVSKVDFFEKYVCITLEEKKVLVIAYLADSDYSWILEECSDNNIADRMQVFCQGNEIVARNISD